MAKRIMKYNPAFLSDEELVSQFVVRHKHMEIILDTIRQNTGNSNQHILVVGPRGIGKTMLVLRVAAEVKANDELGKMWYPLVFGEESYEVGTPGEFWLKALFHLAEQTDQVRWRETYNDLKSEKNETLLRERSLAQLMDFADETGKRILMIAENLNMLLGEQISQEDAWVIRHTLLNAPRLMLLGTATSRFDEFENMAKAMYELFKIHELKPLNDDECRIFWRAITGNKPSLLRIRPIKILTGGNPRLLAIISKFASTSSFKELMKELVQLVDEHTEYFKNHLEGFPRMERKIFVALADLWDPASARQVAQTARTDVNTASSLLNRLIGRGAVELSEKRGRRKCYQVAERMYNIYYLMRRRGHPSDRVRVVVNFMIHFYEPEELIRTTASIALEACGLDSDIRKDHLLAYDSILRTIASEDLKSKILASTPEKFFQIPNIPPSIVALLEKEKIGYQEEREYPISEEESSVRTRLDEEPENAGLWIQLAQVLGKKHDRIHEAENAYRKAAEIDEKNPLAWLHLGLFLNQRTEFLEEAEKAYRKAIDLDPGLAPAWAALALFLHLNLKRFPEAEKAYKKVIELDPDFALPWAHLGQLLHEELDRYEEAEASYRKAIELKPDYAWPWAQLGQLLHEQLGRYEEAEAAYRKAIELKPDYAWPWAQLGQLLHEKLGRYEEAEAAYRKAIELKPDYAWPRAQLGRLLHEELGRYEEAEAAYRKAIEMKPDHAWPWGKLGQLLHEKLGRYEEAEAAYRKIIELNPDCSWAHLLIATVLATMGKWKDSIDASSNFICSAKDIENMVGVLSNLFIDAAASGYEKEVLEMLTKNADAHVLEPLIVGLKLYMGEEPIVAQEILEVGRDVAKRIKSRRQKILNGEEQSKQIKS